jgi:rhodanese-related sulfurtransferase
MDTVSLAPAELHALIGSSAAPVVLDVRRDPAFDADDSIIASALRPQGDLARFAAQHAPGARLVAYCVHGHEVSQEAARLLSQAGHEASYLEGGIEAWRALHLPTVRRRPEWRVPGGSRWITRERPKIDRVACPWLIRRFIDPLARFDYVPREEVLDEARRREAVAYDIDGAPVTHRGERCSFDALIEDFALHDAALDRLAAIVRGADTGRPDLAPECGPLVATSQELSRRFGDDHEMLAHAMTVYDELFARCRAAAASR